MQQQAGQRLWPGYAITLGVIDSDIVQLLQIWSVFFEKSKSMLAVDCTKLPSTWLSRIRDIPA